MLTIWSGSLFVLGYFLWLAIRPTKRMANKPQTRPRTMQKKALSPDGALVEGHRRFVRGQEASRKR